MSPAADSDHREIWSEINETKQAFAKHLGECSVRHSEIIRRQDDSMRDRHGMNLKLDELRGSLSAIESRMLLLWLSVAGGALALGATVAIQLVFRR